MNNKNLDPELKEWLDELLPIEPRDPQAAARGRARFLSQAVSFDPNTRQTGWKLKLFRREVSMNAILSVALALALLFGGSGATVYAAQDALPNQPLYAVKTWTEDARLSLASNPEAEINQLMQMTQQRTQEMAALVDQGQVPPESLELRLQQHIRQALQTASKLNDTDMQVVLQRIQTRLQTQEQAMALLQNRAAANATPILERTRAMLQERLRLCDEGQADPQGFRNAIQSNYRIGQTQIPPSGASGPNGQPSAEPPVQNGNGEGNGYGPGPTNQAGPGGPFITPEPGTGSPSGQGGSGKNKP
jgi:hypothetical protein